MDEPRHQQLSAFVAADRQANPGSWMGVICARCVSELGVSGTGATVLSQLDDDHGEANSNSVEPGEGCGEGRGAGLDRGLVHATNHISAGLEELQLTVGEGPCLDAFQSGGPVLIADLAAETGRWPAFAREALTLGAAAVFSFPLQIGVVRLGSLDCYRDTPGPLTPAQITDALILADLATDAVIAELDGHDIDDVSWLADSHRVIHQATGMVLIQLGTTSEVALMRLLTPTPTTCR